MSGHPPSPASTGPSADALDASVRLARLRQQMFARVEPPRIAQYHVLRQIGGGGMGLVFAAWDPSLDRVVAIKVLRDPWAPASGEALRRLPVDLQLVVELHYWEDHSTAEIAALLELAQGTVKSRLRRAREALEADLHTDATAVSALLGRAKPDVGTEAPDGSSAAPP